jgi:hypothetical protein
MINEQLEGIKKVLATFDNNKNGEPASDVEVYVLKSLWVMLCAEFEGCIKEMVYDYVEKIKDVKDILKIHPLLIITNDFGSQDLNSQKLFQIFNEKLNKKYTINKDRFISKQETCYKFGSIERVFNRLGIFFSSKDKNELKQLDSIASTRDSIAHGDRNISITRKELEQNIDNVGEIYKLLASKLRYTHTFEKTPITKKSKKTRLSSANKTFNHTKKS